MPRPNDRVLEQRAQTFARALAQTGSWREAQRIAQIHGNHVVRLMDRADFRSLAAAMLAGDLPPVVAVEVADTDRLPAAA